MLNGYKKSSCFFVRFNVNERRVTEADCCRDEREFDYFDSRSVKRPVVHRDTGIFLGCSRLVLFDL